jgi:hypothetical protein
MRRSATRAPLRLLFCLLIGSPVATRSTPARAEADTKATPKAALVTDRPDVAEASQTVAPWELQLEVGLFDVESDSVANTRTTRFGMPTKVRFGVMQGFEVHLEGEIFGITLVDVDGGVSSDDIGVADLDIGGKVHFIDQAGLIPSIGLLVALTLPIGSEELTGDSLTLLPTAAFDWDLSPSWSLGTNVGMTLVLSERDSNPDALRFAFAVGRNWAPLYEPLRTYIEVFGEVPFDGSQSLIGMDGGFTWIATPDLQFDITARWGLTDAAADIGGALGVSYRL